MLSRPLRGIRGDIFLAILPFVCLVVTATTVEGQGKRSSSPSSSSSSNSFTPQCDKDRDGSRATGPSCGGKDCDDSDPEIAPGKVEVSTSACQDGKDNDCNGHTDCSDPNCAGKPAFVPGSLSLKPSGMCCPTEAGGQAINTSNDAKNCGGCDVVCDSDEACVAGRCVGGCELARTVCFREPVPFEVPVERDRAGRYPSQIQAILDGINGNPSCSRLAGKDPRFDVKYFSEPLRDSRGKPTGQSIRGVCVTLNF